MARARNIKPSFFTNEQLVELPFEARLMFIGLWTMADREGRLEDRPKRIKMSLFPADDVDTEKLLSMLTESGFIIRYENGGVKYIQIVNFTKHQYPHAKEKASIIPAPGKTHASPSESFNLNPESLPIRASCDALAGFNSFWLAYPKKKSKGQAEKTWKKLNPDEQLQNRLLQALEQAKKSADWQKDGGQFVPYPASWLNAKGWEDEHPAISQYREVVI